MKRVQKTVVLIVVLMAPVFVFLFLKRFGTNQFVLPVYYPEGNPVLACKDTLAPHRLTSVLLVNNIIKLPALFYVPGGELPYYSDLENVLAKYPQVNIYSVHRGEAPAAGSRVVPLGFIDESFLEFINCQLVLGENRWLNEAIPYKYVLADREARIRGYFSCTELDEIERLDTELDILLNYTLPTDETK